MMENFKNDSELQYILLKKAFKKHEGGKTNRILRLINQFAIKRQKQLSNKKYRVLSAP